jgi:thymidylate synthase ThyX
MTDQERLARFVTSTTEPVYALTEQLPCSIAAAAMARLSRCGDDLRTILLREFLPQEPKEPPSAGFGGTGKEEGLLRRVITAYGDDSVQQLVGLHVVVEGASNLLTKLLERPRVGAAYLEQSTRYIFFDTKVGDPPHYRYVVPTELNDEQRIHYCAEMDGMFERYSQAVHRLVEHLETKSAEPSKDAAWRAAIRAQACDAARCLLPAATSSTVGIFASAQALDSLIMHLNGHALGEARNVGNALLTSARQVAPLFFERTDLPERGGATTAYLRETADQVQRYCASNPFERLGSKAVELVDYWPRNEEELGGALGFAAGVGATGASNKFQELVNIYAGQRLNRRHKPGRAFELAHYTFQHRTAYAEFRDLQRHRLVDAFDWCKLEPGEDWDLPQLAEDAGLTHLYSQSFCASYELHEWLNARCGPTVAQYAVLFGHKLNWRWSMNLREAMHIIELRTTPQGHPSYRKLCQDMYAEIARVHPVLASTMKFVNCGEDPELSRLAAERATAFKLSQLQ